MEFYRAMVKLGLARNPHNAAVLVASGKVKIGGKDIHVQADKPLTNVSMASWYMDDTIWR